MKVLVNGEEIDVRENDEIDVQQSPCDIFCARHTIITVDRDGEEIIKIE